MALPKQTINWTLIPNGYYDDSTQGKMMRISVYVQPRLESTTDKSLNAFPDFWDWPKILIGLKPRVIVEGVANPIEAKRISPDPDSELWKTLFQKWVYVAPYKFRDLKDRVILSFPVRNVLGHLENLYGEMGSKSPLDHIRIIPGTKEDYPGPTLQDLISDLAPIGDRRGQKVGASSADSQLVEKLRGAQPGQAKAVDPNANPAAYGFSNQTQFDYYQAVRFYERPEELSPYKGAPDASKLAPEIKPPDVDFHMIHASLGDYPTLMRMLGLVFDIVIPVAGVPEGFMRFDPKFGSPLQIQPGLLLPYTNYSTAGGRFQAKAKSSDPDFVNGMLKLQGVNDYCASKEKNPRFNIVQVDPDGAALKTVDFAVNMMRYYQKKNYSTPDYQPLVSLRTSGLGLVRLGRAYQLSTHLQSISVVNSKAELMDPVGAPARLYAEDLIRGYRPDIFDKHSTDSKGNMGAWFSLTRRAGRYTILDKNKSPLATIDSKMSKAVNEDPLNIEAHKFFGDQPVIIDEGYVKLASATSKDTTNTMPMYLHESLFKWEGWSLTAQRPHRTIESKFDRTTLHQDELVEKNENEPIEKVPLQTFFRAVPGTLPRLRFGRTYRMRARMVDIAGNSHTLDDPLIDNAQATDEHKYLRYESIIPPALVLRTRFTEGESLEVMVIRSNYHKDAKGYVEQDYVKAAIAGQEYMYLEHNDRHVAAPKTSQLMAETHGMFDELLSKGEYQKAYNISAREFGTFHDTKIQPIEPGAPMIELDEKLIDRAPVKGSENYAGADTFPIHKEEQLLLPYLPDVFSRGMTLRGVPNVRSPQGPIPAGESDSSAQKVNVPDGKPQFMVVKVAFKGGWPDAQPFKIRILERKTKLSYIDCLEEFSDNGEPEWDEAQRLLTIYLAKAQRVVLRYSSYLDKEDLEQMGMWKWLSRYPEINLPLQRQYALAGLHWMFTPYRELVLVHAVQQPLCEPSFPPKGYTPYTGYSSGGGGLSEGMGTIGKKSLTIEEAPKITELMVISGGTYIDYTPITPRQTSADKATDFVATKKKIGDTFAVFTGHWLLNVASTSRIDLKARWSEQLDIIDEPTPRDQPLSDAVYEPDGDGSVVTDPTASAFFKSHVLDLNIQEEWLHATPPITNMLPIPSPPGDPAFNPDEKFRQEFSDTKHRFVSYHMVATTRFREYFSPEITRDPANLSRTGPKRTLNILSSARPDAPKILYVIPTFGWEDPQDSGDTIIQRRCGGGLRVYMDRPWYSSGDDELLGVVLYDKNEYVPEDSPMKPFVTQWGMDPIWMSWPAYLHPQPGNFKGSVAKGYNLTLAELPDAPSKPKYRVHAVGYKPGFDAERKLWYCDIEVDTGPAYFPFIRLALARFQPDSMPDCHLSRVVLCDFVQIAPDRNAAVVIDGMFAKVMVSGILGTNKLTQEQALGGMDYMQALGSSRIVTATLEQATSTDAETLSWRPVPGREITLEPTYESSYGFKVIWVGRLQLPAVQRRARAGSDTRGEITAVPDSYRIVFKEWENIRADNGDGAQQLTDAWWVQRRLVYAAEIKL